MADEKTPVMQPDYFVINDSVKMSKSITALATALSQAQGEMKHADKNCTNPHFKSKYADIASINDASKAALTKYGLSVCQMASGEPPFVKMVTILLHKSGEWLSGQLNLRSTNDTPQGMGSAITYARRYALAAVLNIAAEEEDDGNAASVPGVQRPAYQPQPQATAPAAAPGRPGDVLVPVGRDQGKKISELSPQDQIKNLQYWDDREKKEGKPLSGKVGAYRDALRAYLDSPPEVSPRQPQYDDLPPFDDDISF